MPTQIPICRLCGTNSRPLRNSHIVPEFLYRPLYNDKGHMLAIQQSDERRRARGLLQKGIRERLFCEQCEQHFNEHFEKPFLKQWFPNPLPDLWDHDDIQWLTVDDYASFKLFHLSVFFRAAVSSLATYANVDVGRHESVLRGHLLDRNPGDRLDYPIAGRAVIHHQTNRIILRVMTQPTVRMNESHRYFTMVYGGVEWWIKLSSHRHQRFEERCLRPDGRMPFGAVPWTEIPAILRASAALGEQPRQP